MEFNFGTDIANKTCRNCTHALEFGNLSCICNYTRDIKFYTEKCNYPGAFDDQKIKVRKIFVSFAFIEEKENPFTKESIIIYKDSGVGLYADTNASDQIFLHNLRKTVTDEGIRERLEERGIKCNKPIYPIIFAEKVNGKWKQLFYRYSKELSEIMFNNLQ